MNAMHITASVFINDDEPGLHEDYKRWLERLAPFDASARTYAHNRTGEDNADAHMKRQVMGGKSLWRSPREARFRPVSKSSTANSTADGRTGAGQDHRDDRPRLCAGLMSRSHEGIRLHRDQGCLEEAGFFTTHHPTG